ncbi:MAG: peptidylprolyl isomerase [Candidatus Zixiibacteriota bacterium]
MFALRLVLAGVLIAAVAGLGAGCGKSDLSAVAEVGDEKIAIRDFEDFLQRNPVGFRTAEEEFEGKRALLDSLIDHTLLVQAAYAKHIDQSPEVARIMEANRSRFLLDALYHFHVDSKVSVSEAELRQIYDDLQYQIRAFHIMLDSPDTAQAVFERLKAGENFEQLAYQYSTDPRAKRNRGDLGYFVRGSSPEEWEKVVFRLETGEITPPFQTSFGYHIVKVVDKKPNDMREEYARMRPDLDRQLRNDKRQKLTEAYFDSVAAKYRVSVDTTVANYILHKRTLLYPPQVLDQLPKNDFDDEQLDRDEKELILATWEGGQISVIDYLMNTRRYIPQDERPNFDDYAGLSEVVYEMKRMDILIHEAERQKVAESDYYKMKFKTFERYTLAEIMRNDSILAPTTPTEQELRDYYDRNREQYLVPAQVRLFEILASDQMLAQRLAREITTLNQFQARAFQYTERAGQRVKRGDLGFVDSLHFPVLFHAARRVPVGTVGGPIPDRGKFSVIWPVQWTNEAYQDFLTVKGDIAEHLAVENRNLAVREWLKMKRESTDIEVHDDVIWSTINKDLYRTTGSASTTP